MKKITRNELRKHLNSLDVATFADNYAYVFEDNLDRIFFFAGDSKKNRKFYTDKFINHFFQTNDKMQNVILFDLKYNNNQSKKSSKMATKSTKKPTAKQLAARKRFAAMAKSGELAKKRAAASKKKTTPKRKTSLNGKAPAGMTKFAAKNVHVVGVKRDGTLKKGYKYVKGGGIVKIKKATAKK